MICGSISRKGGMVESVQTFYKELSPILEKHRDSLDKLVEGTQVSKVTVWRWLNKINSKHPDPNKLLSVLSKISGIKKVKDLAIFFGGEVELFLKMSFPIIFSEDYELISDFQHEEIGEIKDFYTFLIYTMCGNLGGSSQEQLLTTIGNIAANKADIPKEYLTHEIIKSYGVIALKKIEELENNNIIELKQDGNYHRSTKNMNFDSDIMSLYYPQMIESFFRVDETSLGLNILCGYQETIPAEIANEIARETKEFFLKTMKKMDDNCCESGIPYQIVNFGERLTFDTLNDPLKREVQ